MEKDISIVALGPFSRDARYPWTTYYFKPYQIDKAIIRKDEGVYEIVVYRDARDEDRVKEIDLNQRVGLYQRVGLFNCSLQFFLNGATPNPNEESLTGGLVIKKEGGGKVGILFPLTEEEFCRTNLNQLPLSPGQTILDIPIVEVYDSYGLLGLLHFRFPRPLIRWPKNELEQINPNATPLEIYQLINNLGYSLRFLPISSTT